MRDSRLDLSSATSRRSRATLAALVDQIGREAAQRVAESLGTKLGLGSRQVGEVGGSHGRRFIGAEGMVRSPFELDLEFLHGERVGESMQGGRRLPRG